MSYLSAPARRSKAVTPSDTVDLPFITRGIRVGTTAGDVRVTTVDGDDDVIPNVQIGETVPVMATRIWATNTTATGITALGGGVPFPSGS